MEDDKQPLNVARSIDRKVKPRIPGFVSVIESVPTDSTFLILNIDNQGQKNEEVD